MPVVELSIDDIAFGGKGVGRLNGKAIFVPFAIEGERVAARIVREKKQFAEAELEQVLEPSPHRVAAPCPYFGRCGGCSYQHMSYEHQLAVKERQVEQVLRRIGKFTDLLMRPIIPSPNQYNYRNRITVHAENGAVGYYRRDVHQLIDVERCPIARPEVNRELTELRARKPRDGHYTLRAQSGPRIFFQTNDEVAELLVRHLEELLPSGQQLLIDAYCGAGFFAKRLREKFDHVIGIDWDKFAIAEAKRNATDKETWIAGNIEEALTNLLTNRRVNLTALSGQVSGSTTMIIDPPADGLTNQTRAAIIELKPEILIYVSCNPATLARDLKELSAQFAIQSITPLDMFPQTAEIEVAVHLRARP